MVFPKNSGCVVEFLGAFSTDAHRYPMKEVAGNCGHKRSNPKEKHVEVTLIVAILLPSS